MQRAIRTALSFFYPPLEAPVCGGPPQSKMCCGLLAAPGWVFVVWEPVLVTDWGSPSPGATFQCARPESTHYWDHDRRLSALLGGVERLGGLASGRRSVSG